MLLTRVVIDRVTCDEILDVSVVDEPEASADDVVELLSLVLRGGDLSVLLLFLVGCFDQEGFRDLLLEVGCEVIVLKSCASLDGKSLSVVDDCEFRKVRVLSGNKLYHVNTEFVSALVQECE